MRLLSASVLGIFLTAAGVAPAAEPRSTSNTTHSRPSAAPPVADAAANAAAAARLNPDRAEAIAVSAAKAAPGFASPIAAAVAREVPSKAANIAEALMGLEPSDATRISEAVSAAVLQPGGDISRTHAALSRHSRQDGSSADTVIGGTVFLYANTTISGSPFVLGLFRPQAAVLGEDPRRQSAP